MCKGDNTDYAIVFWDTLENIKYEDLEIYKNDGVILQEIIAKNKPILIILPDYIKRYYWDEQIIVIDESKIESYAVEMKLLSDHGYFSIFLNNKIYMNGEMRTILLPNTNQTKNIVVSLERNFSIKEIYLMIKPYYNDYDDYFRKFSDFPIDEKNRVLNQDVFEYFNRQGKIVRGAVDIEQFLDPQ